MLNNILGGTHKASDPTRMAQGLEISHKAEQELNEEPKASWELSEMLRILSKLGRFLAQIPGTGKMGALANSQSPPEMPDLQHPLGGETSGAGAESRGVPPECEGTSHEGAQIMRIGCRFDCFPKRMITFDLYGILLLRC